MSDYSHYEARIYSERLQTEILRQRAAEEEFAYWQRKREVFEQSLVVGAAKPDGAGER